MKQKNPRKDKRAVKCNHLLKLVPCTLLCSDSTLSLQKEFCRDAIEVRHQMAFLPKNYEFKPVLVEIASKLVESTRAFKDQSSDDGNLIGNSKAIFLLALLDKTINIIPTPGDSSWFSHQSLISPQARFQKVMEMIKGMEKIWHRQEGTLEADAAVWFFRAWLRHLIFKSALSQSPISLKKNLHLVLMQRDSLGKNILRRMHLTGASVEQSWSSLLLKEPSRFNQVLRAMLFAERRNVRTHLMPTSHLDDDARNELGVILLNLASRQHSNALALNLALGECHEDLEKLLSNSEINSSIGALNTLITWDLNTQQGPAGSKEWFKQASTAYQKLFYSEAVGV